MRFKRKSVVLLLVLFLAVVLLLIINPGLRKWVPGSRVQPPNQQAASSVPRRAPALPHSPPAYLPVGLLPDAIKKQAQLAELSVKGRVINTRGEGIPGARVELAPEEQLSLDPPAVAKTVTDEQGYYQLGIQPVAAIAVLRAAKDGYTQGRLTFDLAGETGLIERNLVLRRAEATLSGRVLNAKEEPVPNAKIAFRSEDDPEKQYTVNFSIGSSGKNGEYMFADLFAGRGMLSARAPGYAMKIDHMELEAGENKADIRLDDFPTFYIKALNRRGEPVKYPRAYEKVGRPPRQVGFGDEAGFIDVLLTPRVTSFEWEVRAMGYRPATLTGNPKGGRTDIIMEDGPVISGVVKSSSGRAIPRAQVVAMCRRSPASVARADSDGRFSMNSACTAEVFVEASAPGYVTHGMRLAAEAPKQGLVIKLQEPDGGISGWVLHRDGRPVTRFQIELLNDNPEQRFSISRGSCDPEGRFAILDLPAGKLEMQINAADDLNGPVYETETFQLNIQKGMVYTDLVIRLKEKPAAQ